MSTSTVTIYADTPIIPGRNFLVDSLADYLSAYPNTSKYTVANFQYIKHALNLEIKLDLSQAGQEFLKANNYNYCSITNSTTGAPTVYYFITGITPRSESTLLFSLRMDTLNTFPAVKFGEGTIIERQHEDRFEAGENAWVYPTTVTWPTGDYTVTTNGEFVEIHGRITAPGEEAKINEALMEYHCEDGDLSIAPYEMSIDGETGYVDLYFRGVHSSGFSFTSVTFTYVIWYDSKVVRRKIHLYDEGISPILYKKSEAVVPQVDNQSWNLVYRNKDAIDPTLFNQDNPVTAWLVPDNPVTVNHLTQGYGEFNAGDFPSGFTIWNGDQNSWRGCAFDFYDSSNNKIGTMTFDTTYNGQEGLGFYTTHQYILIRRSGTPAVLDAVVQTYTQYALFSIGKQVRTPNKWTIVNAAKVVIRNMVQPVYATATGYLPIDFPTISNFSFPNTTFNQTYSFSISTIDRKDGKLIKMIKLPFPPNKASKDENGNWVFGDQWEYDSGDRLYKLVASTPIFDYTFNSTIDSPMGIFAPFDWGYSLTKKRYLKDSKFYNSSFYQPKFVYDSFGFVFELEKVDATAWTYKDAPKLNLRFVTSSTFNSKFLFQFPDYILKYSTSDFDNVLPIARNNELPIFTSQYVNYLRTAYRYDLKELDRRKIQTVVNVASSLLSGGNSANDAAMEGNYGYEFATFGRMTASVVNGVLAVERAEDSLKSKMAVLENQAVSISACDDIDLLMAYSNNQAKLVTYAVSPNMEKALSDLWHYCGYAVNTSGVPNMTSRTWFNYCKADVQIIDAENAPTWALDDIKARYMVGVTRLHKVNSSWDFKQEMENYETFS